MSELFKQAFQESGWPLRQSLFWMCDGKPDSTWCWLSRKHDENWRNKMYGKLQSYGVNTIIFIVYCQHNSEYLTNPFCNNASPSQILSGAQVDMVEIDRWQSLLQMGITANINLIPCLFFGDHLDVVQNRDFISYFVPAAVKFLLPYSKGILAGCELNRGQSVPEMTYLINLIKGAMCMEAKRIPVGVHMSSTNFPQKLPPNADFYAAEMPWSPLEAGSHSVNESIREVERIIASSPVPIGVVEDDINCESTRARAFSKALSTLPGCWILPSPT